MLTCCSSTGLQPFITSNQREMPASAVNGSVHRQEDVCTGEHSETAQPSTSFAPGGPASSSGVLPLFDLSRFLDRDGSSGEESRQFCQDMADCLAQTGCLIVRDPRVGTAEADCFLDLMERYFNQPASSKMEDVHPELHYQVLLMHLYQVFSWCTNCDAVQAKA